MTALAWVSLFTNQTFTRATFITDLRTRIDEDTADAISDVQLGRLINQGLRDINNRTGLLPEYCEVTPTGVALYSLPSGFTNVMGVYSISSAGIYTQVTKGDLSIMGQSLASVTDPQYYFRLGNYLYINPYGLTSGTLRVYGNRIPTVPTGDSSYIDLPDEFIELLFMWCEWKYWVRRRVPDEAIAMRDLYLQGCKDAFEKVQQEYVMGATLYGVSS